MEATPGTVIKELQRIQNELSKAPEALYDAENDLAQCEYELDKTEALALLNSDLPTVAERQAHARIEAGRARLERDVARAAVNRIKTKIKVLESAAMAASVIGKQVELTWRTS